MQTTLTEQLAQQQLQPAQPKPQKRHPVIAVLLTVLVLLASLFVFAINKFPIPFYRMAAAYIDAEGEDVTLELEPGSYLLVYEIDTSEKSRPESYSFRCYLQDADGNAIDLRLMNEPLDGQILNGLLGRYGYYWIVGEFTIRQANPTIRCYGDLGMLSHVRIFRTADLKVWRWLSSPWYVISLITAAVCSIGLIWRWAVTRRTQSTRKVRNIMLIVLAITVLLNVMMIL